MKEAIFQKDSRLYNKKIPALLTAQQHEELHVNESPSKRQALRREHSRHCVVNEQTSHILAVLRSVTEKEERSFWTSLNEKEPDVSCGMDPECSAELKHFEAVASRFPRFGEPISTNALDEEHKRLSDHILSIFDQYKQLMEGLRNKTVASSARSQKIVDLSERLRQYPEPPIKHLTPRDIELFLALRSYKIACPGSSDFSVSHFEFPFHMAFSTLAALKAGPATSTSARGPYAFYVPHTSLRPPFGDYSIIRSKLVDALDEEMLDVN